MDTKVKIELVLLRTSICKVTGSYGITSLNIVKSTANAHMLTHVLPVVEEMIWKPQEEAFLFLEVTLIEQQSH